MHFIMEQALINRPNSDIYALNKAISEAKSWTWNWNDFQFSSICSQKLDCASQCKSLKDRSLQFYWKLTYCIKKITKINSTICIKWNSKKFNHCFLFFKYGYFWMGKGGDISRFLRTFFIRQLYGIWPITAVHHPTW